MKRAVLSLGVLTASLAAAQPTQLTPTPPVRESGDAPAPLLSLAVTLPLTYLLLPATAEGARVNRLAGGVSVEFALARAGFSLHLGGGLQVCEAALPASDLWFAGAGARWWPKGAESGWYGAPFLGASLRLDLRKPGGLDQGGAAEPGASLDACVGLLGVQLFNPLSVELALHLGLSSPTRTLSWGIFVAPSLALGFSPW